MTDDRARYAPCPICTAPLPLCNGRRVILPAIDECTRCGAPQVPQSQNARNSLRTLRRVFLVAAAEARAHFSSIARRVEYGNEIAVITEYNRPAVVVVPMALVSRWLPPICGIDKFDSTK